MPVGFGLIKMSFLGAEKKVSYDFGKMAKTLTQVRLECQNSRNFVVQPKINLQRSFKALQIA